MTASYRVVITFLLKILYLYIIKKLILNLDSEVVVFSVHFLKGCNNMALH
jgi:hypothetical protein